MPRIGKLADTIPIDFHGYSSGLSAGETTLSVSGMQQGQIVVPEV
jgi:hypothetical protein